MLGGWVGTPVPPGGLEKKPATPLLDQPATPPSAKGTKPGGGAKLPKVISKVFFCPALHAENFFCIFAKLARNAMKWHFWTFYGGAKAPAQKAVTRTAPLFRWGMPPLPLLDRKVGSDPPPPHLGWWVHFHTYFLNSSKYNLPLGGLVTPPEYIAPLQMPANGTIPEKTEIFWVDATSFHQKLSFWLYIWGVYILYLYMGFIFCLFAVGIGHVNVAGWFVFT